MQISIEISPLTHKRITEIQLKLGESRSMSKLTFPLILDYVIIAGVEQVEADLRGGILPRTAPHLGKKDIERKMVRIIKESKNGLSKIQLNRKTKELNKDKRDKCLADLITSGRVSLCREKRPKGSKRLSSILRAVSYAE